MPENFCPPTGYSVAAEGTLQPGQLSLQRGETTLSMALCAAPRCPVSEARGLRMAAAVCARDAIGGEAKIHWPGEIMSNNKILCRVRFGRGTDRVVFQVELSLSELAAAGIEKTPDSIMEEISHALAQAVDGCPDNLEAAAQRYCQDCVTLMKFVDVTYRGVPVYGFAFAVDRHGGLMVMTQESRTVVTVYSGAATLAQSEPESPELPAPPGR